jgi:hypothetical protein
MHGLCEINIWLNIEGSLISGVFLETNLIISKLNSPNSSPEKKASVLILKRKDYFVIA